MSDRTAVKIRSLHDIDVFEVEDAVICVSGLRFTWDLHHERGWRVMIETSIRGRRALVVLYPRETGDDCWNLGSVYFV